MERNSIPRTLTAKWSKNLEFCGSGIEILHVISKVISKSHNFAALKCFGLIYFWLVIDVSATDYSVKKKKRKKNCEQKSQQLRNLT